MLLPRYTKSMKKDFNRVKKQGKNIEDLRLLTEMIVNEVPLPERYKKHPLCGKYGGTLECHIASDWLLIFEIDDAAKTVVFHRTGSHSDLF